MNFLVTLLLIPLALAEKPCFIYDYDNVAVKDVKISVIQDIHKDIEKKLRDSFEASEKMFTSTGAEVGTVVITSVVGSIPVIGSALSGAISVIKLIGNDKADEDFTKPLLDAIQKWVDQKIERELVKSDLRGIRIKMGGLETIGNTLVSKTTDSATKLRDSAVADNKLDELVIAFSDEESLLRKFPLVAVPPLLGLAAFVPPFEAMKYRLLGDWDRNHNVSCKLAQVMTQYRSLDLTERVKWLKGNPPIDAYVKAVLALTYDPKGYFHSEKLTCSTPFNIKEGNSAIPYIHDNFESKGGYYVPVTFEGGHCLPSTIGMKLDDKKGPECFDGYLKVLRGRVENIFDRPISKLNDICVTLEAPKHP